MEPSLSYWPLATSLDGIFSVQLPWFLKISSFSDFVMCLSDFLCMGIKILKLHLFDVKINNSGKVLNFNCNSMIFVHSFIEGLAFSSSYLKENKKKKCHVNSYFF